jgi:hypothetical protein
MEWKNIIKELDDLHEARKSMAYASIYHASYVDKAVELNTRLIALTGFSYVDHKTRQRLEGRVNGQPL